MGSANNASPGAVAGSGGVPTATPPGARVRSRHQRHLATTAQLHALRASTGDESTLLTQVSEILADSFAARGACIVRHGGGTSDDRFGRLACTRRNGAGPCPALSGLATGCDSGDAATLRESPGIGRIELGDVPRLLLEVALSDGERLVVRIEHPFDELGRDLGSEDLRDDLAHLEELGRVLVDVLDVERSHARLRTREAELSTMLGAIPDTVTIIDGSGHIVSFHDGDTSPFAEPSRFIGRHLAELLPPDVWRARVPIWQRAIVTRRVQEHRYSLERDGRTLHFVARGQAYGEPVRVLWHTRDVTEEWQLQEKLLSIQRFEGIALLASALAHDFSNVLTGILGNAEFARAEMSPTSPGAEALSDVISAAKRASDLCQQLLGMSGKRSFSLGFVNLSALCEEMLVILRTSIAGRITVVRELAPEESMPVLIGDAIQLRQIVLNLLSYASDAIGDEGGSITVRTGIHGTDGAPDGQWAFLEVEDSGRGLDEPARRRLFEPSLSVPLAARELGLAATLGIVRGHGGTVEVISSPSAGTRVRVLLPLDPEASGTGTGTVPGIGFAPADERLPGLHRGGLVLLVSTDHALVATCRRALEHGGHRVQHIGSGEEALIALRAITGLVRGIILDTDTMGPDAGAVATQVRDIAPTTPRLVLGGAGPVDDEGPFQGVPLSAEVLGRALARLMAQL